MIILMFIDTKKTISEHIFAFRRRPAIRNLTMCVPEQNRVKAKFPQLNSTALYIRQLCSSDVRVCASVAECWLVCV